MEKSHSSGEPEGGSLRKEAASGSGWAALTEVGAQGLRFGVGLVLAWLVAPDQFGLLAMVSVFVVISTAVAEGGLGGAIIQRKVLTDVDCSTVFWFNLASSLVMAGLVCVIAPWIAAFYNEARLIPLMQVLSLGLVIQAFATCQRARLSRELKFRKLMWAQLPAVVIGAVAGITIAARGYGVWALVWQNLVTGATTSMLLWITAGWRPRVQFSTRSFREMFGYGWKVALERTIDVAVRNIYVLVIGKLFLPVQVGYYQRANAFQELPATLIHRVVGSVMFPLMSSIQDNLERMRRGFEEVLRIIAIASFPIFAGMMVVAEPMIETLIGPRWLPCAPYLQLLCMVGLLWPTQALNLTVLLAKGRSGLSLKLAIVKRVALALAILLTFRHGVMALLWGQVACALFALCVNSWPNRKLIDFPIEKQLAVMLPYLISAALMAGVVWTVLVLVEWPSWAELGVGSTLGASVYFGCLKLMNFPAHRKIADLASGYRLIGPVARFLLT